MHRQLEFHGSGPAHQHITHVVVQYGHRGGVDRGAPRSNAKKARSPAGFPARLRGRSGCKPSSVARAGRPSRAGDHSSRTRVTARLMQPTRRLGRAALSREPLRDPHSTSLFGLAPGGVCRAAPVTGGAVGSYPAVSPLPRGLPVRGSALSRRAPFRLAARRSVFCGTLLEVTLTGRYPAPCPVELGLSSRGPRAAGDHLPRCDTQNLATCPRFSKHLGEKAHHRPLRVSAGFASERPSRPAEAPRSAPHGDGPGATRRSRARTGWSRARTREPPCRLAAPESPR